MKRLAAASLATLLAIPGTCAAWGRAGHSIVARVAESRLTRSTRHELNRIIGKVSLASVSTWADRIRDDRPETKRWHYVNIPVEGEAYEAERDCRRSERGDCLIAAIERSRSILANASATRDARSEAAKYLIHFIGDLHQPLHCSEDDDAGGNRITVRVGRKTTNLHSFWDTAIIRSTRRRTKAFADLLILRAHDMDGDGKHEIEEGDPIAWAMQSNRIAREQVRVLPVGSTPVNLGGAYTARSLPIVEDQLMRGGIRLALVLNQIFSPEENDASR